MIVDISKEDANRLMPHPLWWDMKKLSYICPVCKMEYFMPKNADAILDFSDDLHYCMRCGTKLEGVKDVY